MKTNCKLIMMDMGGVLALHTDQSMEQALLSEFQLDGYTSFSHLDPSLPALLQEHSKASIDEKEMWKRFTEITHIKVPEYQGSLWAKYFKPELDTSVLAIMEKLKTKGHRIVCATNTEDAHYHYHLVNGQYTHFDAVYASCIIKRVKPDKDFFSYILQAEKIEASEAFFIDDYQENCASASELGIPNHWYTNPIDLEKQLNDIGLL